MEELVQEYLAAIRALLLASGLREDAVKQILKGIFSGNASIEREYALLFARSGEACDAPTAELPKLMGRLARATLLLRQPTVDIESLGAAVDIMRDAGDISLRFGIPRIAYNFFEIAWHVGGFFDRNALDVAQNLRIYSDPDNVDQYHGSIWRLAIEQLRHAIDTQSDYQQAINAIELALVCRVLNPGLQTDLFHRLYQQVGRGRGPLVDDLAALVITQAPPTAWDADKRRMAQRAMAGRRLGERVHRIPTKGIEIFAVMEAQAILDDLLHSLASRENQPPKIKLHSLASRKKPPPQVNWHDLRYRDSRLANSVPLGRSLIADPERSAVLLLDLAHEIGHALALQGPIGMRQASYRAAINYLEMLMLDLDGRQSMSDSALRPALAALPNHPFGRALAATQLEAALMAAIERAIWRSWLEGLSMYVEMLADPSDDPDQISMLHTSIRSLIDFNIPPDSSESSDEYAERLSAEVNQQFESFYSEAINKRSRVQHLAYFNDSGGNGREGSDLYVLGYIQVRTVVAAWEAALGRKVAPTIAARLLFTSTMAGVFNFYEGIGSIEDTSIEALCERYCTWLDTLAVLPADSLAEFFTPTGRDQPGVAWTWTDELKRIDKDPTAAERVHADRMDALEQHTLRLARVETSSSDEATAAHATMLRLLLQSYIQENALVPIGTSSSKLLFLDDSEHVGLGVRTYDGHAAPVAPDSAAPDRHNPRYHFRFWAPPGGDAEKDQLRRACGRANTSRLSVSRIIDFAGRPELPFALPGTSYVCGFLGRDLAIVLPWAINTNVACENPTLVETLRNRLLPMFGIADEASTTASLEFLAKRILNIDPSDSRANVAKHLAFEGQHLALRFAYAGVAHAIGITFEEFTSIYEDTMKDSSCREAMARMLHSTGRGKAVGKEQALVGKRLTELLLDTSSFSGVKPFGGKK